ncbi:MAG: rod shape-determining protein MreC [Saprospiraceae bacterium]|nr:rod shape-determining protein MreC [Saprospiraceae bacterium]
MGKILQLLLRNGGFVTFVLVEVFCFIIIVQFNKRQNAIFTHTTGLFAGRVLERRQEFSDYIGLKERIDSLNGVNAQLQTDLANARIVKFPMQDTFIVVLYDSLNSTDSVRRRVMRPLYEYYTASVIGNSISSANNWLMINRGSKDHIAPNMAVVTNNGIVGIVRHVDDHFSMVMSVLHRQTKISAALSKFHAFGSLIWEGGDPSLMTLKYIPKHFEVKPGDEVVTSGFSQMFPREIRIGTVEGEAVQDPENPYFLVMKVRLSQDMSTVGDVYVVKNLFQPEQDSLQVKVRNEQ